MPQKLDPGVYVNVPLLANVRFPNAGLFAREAVSGPCPASVSLVSTLVPLLAELMVRPRSKRSSLATGAVMLLAVIIQTAVIGVPRVVPPMVPRALRL